MAQGAVGSGPAFEQAVGIGVRAGPQVLFD